MLAPGGSRAGDDGPGPPAEAIDSHPWNPDVLHANIWPYDEPLKIPTEYYGPPGEFWLRGEYFVWGLKGDRLPPLVSSGPAGGTLFGGQSLNLDPYFGGRFTGGVWFESSYCFGFEGTYFFLADQAGKFASASSGTPVLARPFVDAATGLPAARVLAAPGAAGGVSVQASTELQGAEGSLVWNLHRGPAWSFEIVGGFRYLDLGGELRIVDATAAAGNSTITVDELAARNHFYGGQVGGRAEYRWHCLVLDLTEKLALGGRTTDITIAGGAAATTAAGTTTQTVGGLLAQTSNIGRHSDDSFAVVNEISIQAGWQFSDCVKAFVGYSFLYFNSVVRPGGLVNLNVPAAFAPQETDFWAHGLNAGLEIRY